MEPAIDREARALLARVDTLADSWLAVRRSQFATTTGHADTAAVKAGALNGSGHRLQMHELCATELVERREHLCKLLLATHKAMSGSPRPAIQTAAKDWSAARLHHEATELARLLPQPQTAFGDHRAPDTLTAECEREIKTANAVIDNAFDALLRDRVERVVRWIARTTGALARFRT